MTKDIVASAVQGTPGYAVTIASVAGFHLSDLAVILTIIWTAISIVHTIVKWNRNGPSE